MGEPNLDIKKKMVHEIVVDSWNATKKYFSIQMNDDDWEEFVKDTENLSRKWKCQGTIFWMLYRNMIGGLRDALVAFQKGEADGTN